MKIRSRWNRFAFFNDDDGGGDGGPPGGGGGGGGPARQSRQERESGLLALRARYRDDLERAVEVLYDENYDLRDKNRKLRDFIEKTKLPEGAVVLTKEQAADWEAYQKLGKPADLVKKELLDDATGKLQELEAERVHHRAAGLLGWKGSVTHDLLKSKGLHVEVKDEQVDGKPVQRAYVRPKGDEKAALVLLDKYVSENLKDYLPSLKGDGTAAPILPNQGPAGSGSPGTTLADSFLAKKEEARRRTVSPLRPTPAAATKSE